MENELCRFTYITANSPTLPSLTHVTDNFPTIPSLHLHHSSFYNPFVSLPTSQLIFQLFCRFTYITAHSRTLLSLHLRHSLFSNTFIALPTSQLMSNTSITSPTSQLILESFFRFSYVTGSSLTSPGEPPMEIVMMKIKLVVTPQSNKPPLSLSQKWRRGSTNAVNIIIAAVRERG